MPRSVGTGQGEQHTGHGPEARQLRGRPRLCCLDNGAEREGETPSAGQALVPPGPRPSARPGGSSGGELCQRASSRAWTRKLSPSLGGARGPQRPSCGPVGAEGIEGTVFLSGLVLCFWNYRRCSTVVSVCALDLVCGCESKLHHSSAKVATQCLSFPNC